MADPTLRDVITPIVRELVAERGAEPMLVSQRNVEAVLGISARMHLEFCRREDFSPRVLRVGKLRLVDAREYRVWLRTLDERASQRNPDPDGPDAGINALAAEFGLNPGRRR